jgi:hypothetical protein
MKASTRVSSDEDKCSAILRIDPAARYSRIRVLSLRNQRSLAALTTSLPS